VDDLDEVTVEGVDNVSGVGPEYIGDHLGSFVHI
jgi:hypothetical protein